MEGTLEDRRGHTETGGDTRGPGVPSLRGDNPASPTAPGDTGSAVSPAVSPLSPPRTERTPRPRDPPGDTERDGDKVCAVCGDRASGYHFHVMSCEGCKGFFRRSVIKGVRFTCPLARRCPVTKAKRRQCQACRLQKCLDAGMRRDMIMSEEALRRRRELRGQRGRPGGQRGLTGEQPGLTGERPGLTGEQRGLTGEQRGLTGEQRGRTGERPGLTGEQRGLTGEQPGLTGEQPGLTGEQRGRTGERPGLTGERPGLTGEQPGLTGERPGLTGERPGRTGEQPGLTGERPGLTGEQPGLTGERPGLTGERRGLTGEQRGRTGEQPGLTGEQRGRTGERRGLTGEQPGLTGEQRGRTGERRGRTGERPGLTGEQRELIELLIGAHRRTFDSSFSQFMHCWPAVRLLVPSPAGAAVPAGLSPSPSLSPREEAQPDALSLLPQFADLSTFMIQQVIRFAKDIPVFRSLSLDTQISLLKGATLGICQIRFNTVFNPRTKAWECGRRCYTVRDGALAGFQQVYLEPLLKFHERLRRLRLHEAEYALLQAMLLFSPDHAGIAQRDVIDQFQEKVALTLKSYIDHRHPPCEGRFLYAKLLLLLTELQTLKVENTRQILHIQELSAMTPLLSEIIS